METQLRDYPLTSTIVKLKTGRVQLTLIEEPDWFLEQLSREDTEGKLYLPYWTYIWESSIGLACHVETLGAQLRAAQTLEIGCGFGLAGIVACRMGARVVFTDVERDALHFAHHNAEQNDVVERADFVQMDWNTPCFNGKFRYILAADVIYEEHHWQPIVTLLQEYLTPNGIALFAEPNRDSAIGFFKLLDDNGFVYEKSTCPVKLDRKPSYVSIHTVQHINA
ncbi:MAG: methyltransferase domain-containing protein [Candidatus Poribacteria bacterium]|nr:methyltransferase domain-containing protein [Candidatus Poribacteria bacterium]